MKKAETKKKRPSKNDRALPAACRLVDRLVPQAQDGPLRAILATTYELQTEFLETDFLPSLLGLGSWDDRNWTSRIAIEKSLAGIEAAAVFVDASCYRGRPRTLQLTVHPVTAGRGRILHAKVTLLVHAHSVRVLVSSANLTESGYRKNREIAVSLRVTADDRQHAPLVRDAVAGLRTHLVRHWDDDAERAASLATGRLDEWGPEVDSQIDRWFCWSGADNDSPLWRQVIDRWPQGDSIHSITLVSPFWSEEEGTGPLIQLLGELRQRRLLQPNAHIRILSDARPVSDDAFLPILPASYRSWNPSALQVRVTAAAVDPRVPPGELDGMEDSRATRRLHAKLAVFEGETHTLAYLGSANFTHHGWGFAGGVPANLEAGIVLRARDAERAKLLALVPATVGAEVALDGAADDQVALLAATEPSPPWPAFLREVRLVPLVGAEPLGLEATVFVDEVAGEWSLRLLADLADVLVGGDRGGSIAVRMELTAEQLERLLRDREVLVQWWECGDGVRFPINVSVEVRDRLPIAPGVPHPSETLLLAYYQGRILWEALYPDPESERSTEANASAVAASQVDTSKIQAYQVREFVEALRGLRDDLKAASTSVATMRLAVLGPVSPVALARHSAQAVQRRARTPFAGAFQLIEILGCLDEALRIPLQQDQPAWRQWLTAARSEVTDLTNTLQTQHPTLFPIDGPFHKFQRSLELFHQTERA